MRKKIYTALCQRLHAAALGIRHIGLWNKNTDQLVTEPEYAKPAVFVEFEPVEWSQLPGRTRSGDLRVRLHIVTDLPAAPAEGGPDTALGHLDLIERITAAVQGLSGEGFNAFQLVESLTDHDHGASRADEECFVTHATDTSAQRPQTVISGVTLKRG